MAIKSGTKIERMMVLKEIVMMDTKHRHSPRQYFCYCDCGRSFFANAAAVEAGVIKDCGHHADTWRVPDGKVLCKYTEGVDCTEYVCEVCGHCPETAKRRVQKWLESQSATTANGEA